MTKLILSADAALTDSFPRQRAARLSLLLNDGTLVEHFSPHRKGDPEAPLSDAELIDKFNELTVPVIGSERARRLQEQVWSLDTLAVKDLTLNSYISINRSEERRVGKECVSTCRSRWSPYH